MTGLDRSALDAMQERADAATFVGGDMQVLAEDVLDLLDEVRRLTDALAEAEAAPCDMRQGEPYDFAWCETHDTTFPLGQTCKFDGRDPAEVYADEADEQRGRAVRAEATLAEVRALHRRAHVIATRGVLQYETPCPGCDGKAGVHPCGCWADQDVEFVCAECHRLGARSAGVYDYVWPCATARVLDRHQGGEA